MIAVAKQTDGRTDRLVQLSPGGVPLLPRKGGTLLPQIALLDVLLLYFSKAPLATVEVRTSRPRCRAAAAESTTTTTMTTSTVVAKPLGQRENAREAAEGEDLRLECFQERGVALARPWTLGPPPALPVSPSGAPLYHMQNAAHPLGPQTAAL